MKANRLRTGFTLVEVLVVLGVVTVMVGLLLPALGKARESARRTVCGSNLRQVYFGVQMYAQDNAGRMPPRFDFVNTSPQAANVAKGIRLNLPEDGIQTVLGRYVTSKAFECPSDVGDVTSDTPVFVRRGTSYSVSGADQTQTDVNRTKFNLKYYRHLGGDLFKFWDAEDKAGVAAKVAAGQLGPVKWHRKVYNMLLADGRVVGMQSKAEYEGNEKR